MMGDASDKNFISSFDSEESFNVLFKSDVVAVSAALSKNISTFSLFEQ